MGMGKEISDFVNAYGAGKKIQAYGDDAAYKKLRGQRLQQQIDLGNDPKMKDLATQRLQAQVNYFNARAARSARGPDAGLQRSRALTNQLRELQIKQLMNPPKVPSAADDAPSFSAPTVGPQSALPVDQQAQPMVVGQADTGYDDGSDQPTNFSASGGLVTRKGYAGGGAVDDEEDEAPAAPDEADISPEQADMQDAQDGADDQSDGADDEPQGALPVGAGTPQSASQTPAAPVKYSAEAAHDAALAGAKLAARATGHDGGDGAVTTDMSARALGSRKYLSGHGAMSQDDFNAVADAVDPKHTLSDSERTMATLGTKYMWDLKHDPAAADAHAAAMTQFLRMQSDRYKAIAQAAAHHGDLDGTMKNLVRSYASIPTGDDLKLEKTANGNINYSVTDSQTGKVQRGGIMNPDQLLSWATKGGMPTYDELLTHSASGRAELAANAKAKGAGGLKPADNKKINDGIDGAVANLDDAGTSIKSQLSEIKPTAFQMQRANPGINPDDALSATLAMTQVTADNVKDPSKAFTIIGKPGDDQVKVKLGTGQTVVVPTSLIPRLAAQRAKNAKVLLDSQASSSKVGNAVSGALDAAGRVAKSVGAAVMPGQRPGPAPVYGNPLQELHDQGRVSGTPTSLPASAPQSALDRINMARRAKGLPPLASLPQGALPVGQ